MNDTSPNLLAEKLLLMVKKGQNTAELQSALIEDLAVKEFEYRFS